MMAEFYRQDGELCFQDDRDRTFTVDSVWESDGPGDITTSFFILGLDFETEDYVMYYCVKGRGGYLKDSNVKQKRMDRDHVARQEPDQYDVQKLNAKNFRDPLFFKQGLNSFEITPVFKGQCVLCQGCVHRLRVPPKICIPDNQATSAGCRLGSINNSAGTRPLLCRPWWGRSKL